MIAPSTLKSEQGGFLFQQPMRPTNETVLMKKLLLLAIVPVACIFAPLIAQAQQTAVCGLPVWTP